MTDNARLEDLEIRLMHQEASIDSLTQSLLEQERISREQAERIRMLEQQVKTLTPSLIADASEETPPPHY